MTSSNRESRDYAVPRLIHVADDLVTYPAVARIPSRRSPATCSRAVQGASSSQLRLQRCPRPDAPEQLHALLRLRLRRIPSCSAPSTSPGAA
eukprot:14267962-Alexandrium_andersonii.AAC.1